ncbi:MAG: pilus assembly protein TadG-related protein [Aquihabitans sp.]
MPKIRSFEDPRGRKSQRGQVVPLLAVALVLFGAVALGLVQLSATVAHRSAAQATADASALAGAVDGRQAAQEIAMANDARMVDYIDDGGEVQVTVERRGVRATARARWEPVDQTG